MSLISAMRLASSAISKSAGTSCAVVIGSQRGPAVLESIFNRDDSVCHYVADGTASSYKYSNPPLGTKGHEQVNVAQPEHA